MAKYENVLTRRFLYLLRTLILTFSGASLFAQILKIFKNREDIDPEKALILTTPVDPDEILVNFLHKEKIHKSNHLVRK
ncbi:MAG: hypothetical protein M0Q38_02735 [Bacteroidales bacterium]|nr:hypothetical protein [Bacteroidales bacterium]